MNKQQCQTHIDRLYTRLTYFQRKQTHMQSHIDLLEEQIESLKIYLDTLSPLPEKYFELSTKIDNLEHHVCAHSDTKKGAQ